MATQTEIRELKTYLFDLYQNTRAQQSTDASFYNDTFAVPQIRNPYRIQRTGRASRMIDSPAEHIVTSNPQATRKPDKDTQVSKIAAISVSCETNRWIDVIKKANPNPFKDFVKNLLLRGEAWVHPLHNERWVVRPIVRKGTPVNFIVPDPMIIWADPNEDENGVPERVIVWYERMPSIIKNRYPNWKGPKDTNLSTVNWLEYWDNEQIHFEADDETVFDSKNIYGFVPFVHKLSGFGKGSPDGKMEDLIVGRLRKVRDVLTRECAIVSDIDATFHLFANKSIDVQPTDNQSSVPDDFAKNYEFGPGLVHELPFGITVTKSEEITPTSEIFQYLYRITAELEKEDPLVLAGIATGSTGRQQDMTMTSAMTRYDTIVENTAYAFARAFGMGLEMCEKIPTLSPTEYGLTKTSIGGNYEVAIDLKAKDPLEDDRKATLGSRLYAQGEIDLLTNLTKYQGYSQDEADDIMTNILVDRVTFQSPDVAELMGMKLAEKAGMKDELDAIKQRRAQMGAGGGLGQMPGQAEMTQRTGQVQTPSGREMIDMALSSRGQRNAPVAYNRNA